jgi:hypothetical protein
MGLDAVPFTIWIALIFMLVVIGRADVPPAR